MLREVGGGETWKLESKLCILELCEGGAGENGSLIVHLRAMFRGLGKKLNGAF